jgi:hypothetical protein
VLLINRLPTSITVPQMLFIQVKGRNKEKKKKKKKKKT